MEHLRLNEKGFNAEMSDSNLIRLVKYPSKLKEKYRYPTFPEIEVFDPICDFSKFVLQTE